MKSSIIFFLVAYVALSEGQWFSRAHRNHAHHGRRGPPRGFNGLRPPPMAYPPPSLLPPVSPNGTNHFTNPSTYYQTTEASKYQPIGLEDLTTTPAASVLSVVSTLPPQTPAPTQPPSTTPVPYTVTTTTTAVPLTTQPTSTTTAAPQKNNNDVFSDHMIEILNKLGELTNKLDSQNQTNSSVPDGITSPAMTEVVKQADAMRFGDAPPPSIEYPSTTTRRSLIPLPISLTGPRTANSKQRPPLWKNVRGIFSWKRQSNQPPRPAGGGQNPVRRFDYNVQATDATKPQTSSAPFPAPAPGRARFDRPHRPDKRPPPPPPPRRHFPPTSLKPGIAETLLSFLSDKPREPKEALVSTTTPKVITYDVTTGPISRSMEVSDRQMSQELSERSGNEASTLSKTSTLNILTRLSPKKPIMVFMREEGIVETMWAGADPGKVVKKYAGSTKIQFFNGTLPKSDIPAVFLAPGDMKPPKGYGKMPIPKVDNKGPVTTEKPQYLPIEEQIRLLRLQREKLKLRQQQLQSGFFADLDTYPAGTDTDTKVLKIQADQYTPGFYDQIRNSLPKDAIIESIEPMGNKYGQTGGLNNFYKSKVESPYYTTKRPGSSHLDHGPVEVNLPASDLNEPVNPKQIQKIVGSLLGSDIKDYDIKSPYDRDSTFSRSTTPPPPPPPPPKPTNPFPPKGFHQIPSPNLQFPPNGPEFGPELGPLDGPPDADNLFSVNMKLFYQKGKGTRPPPGYRNRPMNGPPPGAYGPPDPVGHGSGHHQGVPNDNNKYNNQGPHSNGPTGSNDFNHQGPSGSYNQGYNGPSGPNNGYNHDQSLTGPSGSSQDGYYDESEHRGVAQLPPKGRYKGKGHSRPYHESVEAHSYDSKRPSGHDGHYKSSSGSRRKPYHSSEKDDDDSQSREKEKHRNKNSRENFSAPKKASPTIILHSSKNGYSRDKPKRPTIVITGTSGKDMSSVNKIINSLNMAQTDYEESKEKYERTTTTTTTPRPRTTPQKYYQVKTATPVYATTAAPTYLVVQTPQPPAPATIIINNTSNYDSSVPQFSFDELFPAQQPQQQIIIAQSQPAQAPPAFVIQQNTPQLFPQILQQPQQQSPVIFQVNSLPQPTMATLQAAQNSPHSNAIVVPNSNPGSPLPPVIFVPNPPGQQSSIAQPSAAPSISVTPTAHYQSRPSPPDIFPAEIFQEQIQEQHEAAVASVTRHHHQRRPDHRQPDVDLKAGIFPTPTPTTSYGRHGAVPHREFFVAGPDLDSPTPTQSYYRNSQMEVEPVPTLAIDMDVQSYAKIRPAGVRNAAGEQVIEKVKTEEKIVWEQRPQAGMVPLKVTTQEKSFVHPDGRVEVQSSVVDSKIAEEFINQQPYDSIDFFKRGGLPTNDRHPSQRRQPAPPPPTPMANSAPPSVSPFAGLLKSKAQLEKFNQENSQHNVGPAFHNFRSTVFG